MPNWTGKWDGGRTYRDKAGKTIWQLERMHGGARYSRRLDAGNEKAALAVLALFERDPSSYLTRTQAAAKADEEAVHLDPPTVARFLDHLKGEGRTERYRKNLRTYLSAWAEILANRDLRSLSLQELKRCLARWPTARKNRIIAIKSFFSFLREVSATLPSAQDATLALKVPPARPERARRQKGYAMAEIERLYRAMDGWESKKLGGGITKVQCVRDVLLLHAKSGLHGTEIERLARGEGEVKMLHGYGEIAGTIKFVHKSGRVHLQSLDQQAMEAAQRLQARGSAPTDSWIRKVIARTAKSIGAEPIRTGELRHSFVAWAHTYGQEIRPAEGGIPLSAIAAAIGHQSANTTKRFYDVAPIPPMIKVPIKLEHPEDPLLYSTGSWQSPWLTFVDPPWEI